MLDPDKADIKRDDEPRWNAAYRELEALERLVKQHGNQISQETITDSRIGETNGLLCARFELLHIPPKAEEDGSPFALMYASWELTMRIGASLGISPQARLESEGQTNPI